MSNAIVEESQQHAVAKKQLYLQRVNQLYTDIRNWLQDEPLILEPGEIDVIEALGQYKAPRHWGHTMGLLLLWD
jgi:hypothetical protein